MAVEAPAGAPAKAARHLEELLDGVPANVRQAIDVAAAHFVEENDPDRGVDERSKAAKLRAAYNALSDFLVKERLARLNPAQVLFLSTGAVTDEIEVAVPDGDPVTVRLLDPALFARLAAAMKVSDGVPRWAKQVHTNVDKYRAIAKGSMLYLDPNRKKAAKKDDAPKDVSEQVEQLKMKQRVLARDGAPMVDAADPAFSKFMGFRNFEQVKQFKEHLDALRTYLQLAALKDLAPDEEAARRAAEAKAAAAPAVLAGFAQKLEEIGRTIREPMEQLSGKVQEYFRIQQALQQLGGGGAPSDSGAVIYDDERVGWIRREIESLSGMVVRGADTAPTRIPWSAARILISEHADRIADPIADAYCTPDNVVKALQKIMNIHVNLFPRDDEGNPQVLPITIEPIRNFVECLDDRMIVSFVSGEQERKGPKLSFTPVEMQVMRACGMYVARDPIYDYRGKPNLGTFMGEYAGKIEKSAQVKWAGEDKKFTIVSAAEVTDKAGREEAVVDYMDFIFHLVNELNPPHKLSKRKIAVLLRYCVIENSERTTALLLRYCAQTELDETKDSLTRIATNSLALAQPGVPQNSSTKRDEAKRLIQAAYKRDGAVAQVMGDNVQQTILRLLGKDDPPARK